MLVSHKGSLERRAAYLVDLFFEWAIEFREKRTFSMPLNVSDLITLETSTTTEAERGTIDGTRSKAGNPRRSAGGVRDSH
jgi:hypothetical protein